MKLKSLYHGWVLVAIAACILGTQQALIFMTFGVFLRPITMEFNWDRGVLSGAYSMCVLLSGIFAILTGRLSDKYGPRVLVTLSGLLAGTGFLLMSQISSLWQVYLAWGLLMGAGASCCYTPTLSTIPKWFVKRRGIAVAITGAGFGLGGIIWPPVAQWLISAYGWQQALLILGLIIFVIVIPLAQFMKHSPQRIGLKPYGANEALEDKQPLDSATEELSFTQALKTSRFWVLGLIFFCLLFFIQVIFVHVNPYAVDSGISAMVAASILSIFAGLSATGQLSMGFLSERIGGRLALTACLILATLALVWLLFAREIWMFYLFAVIFGLAVGGTIPLQTILSAKLFGLKSLGMILGAILLLGTTGGAIGPILAGSIFDITGNYNLAFQICIIFGVVSILLGLILLRYKGKKGVA